MNHLKQLALICILATLILLLRAGVAGASSTWACGTWHVMTSPNPSLSDNSLSSVTALSINNAWAVGEYFTGNNFSHTLIEHWDGHGWRVVSSPNAGSSDNILTSVVAISVSDVWAVGFYNTHRTSPARTLIEHWDGTTWSIVPSADAGSSDNILHGVTALSANNIWAVGAYNTYGNSPLRTLVEHWDGVKWRIVSSPNTGSSSNGLAGVTAVSGTDIWAVGNAIPKTSPLGQTLIEHWNGHIWSIVVSPNITASNNNLAAVVAFSTNDIWAVGNDNAGLRAPLFTLIEHWNGTRWNIITSPNSSSKFNSLTGVTAISSGNVWAVGAYTNTNGSGQEQTLIEHWNGTRWNIITSPNPSSTFNSLSGAARVPATDQMWAVGDDSNGSRGQTLTEFGEICVA